MLLASVGERPFEVVEDPRRRKPELRPAGDPLTQIQRGFVEAGALGQPCRRTEPRKSRVAGR